MAENMMRTSPPPPPAVCLGRAGDWVVPVLGGLLGWGGGLSLPVKMP